MDAKTDARDTNKTGKDPDGILKDARSDWDRAYDRDHINITKAYEDLIFLAAEDLAQWPEKQRKEREDEGRPVLQINQLPQFINQITGDIRQMRPSIKVVPVDSQSDPQTADLLGGLIRYIENRSDASAIYFKAADSQVSCGIGHWRVATEYADDTTFNQELRIAPVSDQVAILWDPDSELPSREDARFCFVPVDLSRAAFEKRWPKATPSSFDDDTWRHNHSWVTDDYIRVAEYWVKKPAKRKLALLPTGEIADITQAEEDVIAYYLAKGARIEERDSYQVCRYLITASDVLEKDEWIGRHIPIVPALGVEIQTGRKVVRKGVVRDAMDPQRMNNYFHSAHTEVVALQPKAPYMVTETNVAKYQELWEQANTKNLPYLPYEPDSKNGGAAPQRVPPPVSSQGILDGLMMSKDDLRSTIGIYDAGLGKESNETSGKAILARQREGDVGSYVYIDNFSRAIRRTGQILIDLIPHVYDAERTIRIMGEDGKIDLLEINKAKGLNPETGQTEYLNDVTIGAYDVVATAGPSYTTRREEAKESMLAFMQAVPDVAPLMIDLFAKSQDWPLSDDIAKRARASLPPHILQAEELEKQGASPEEVQQALQQGQQQPDPKVIEMQAKLEMERQKMAFEQQKAQADMQMQAAKMEQEARLAEQKLAAEIALKREELQAKLALEQERLQVETQIKVQQAQVDSELRKQDMEARSKERAQAAKTKKKEAA